MLSLLLSVIELSLTLKSDIVGGELSVWTVVIARLSVETFPAESETVNVTVLFCELLREGLENDFVKVYVLPLTFVCVAPLTEILSIPLLSETTAVKVAVLLDESESDEYQVRVEELEEKDEIDGAVYLLL